ncbi:MAG: membrane protein insertase YidC [Coxiella sp. (in: Bacteria)]|nr:MAG: membrane protein insertase YidC [Coxiella sp. (in: g-proteobacteria)]
MDSNKIFKYALYALAAILGLTIYNAWHKDYPTLMTTATTATASTASSSQTGNNFVPQEAAPTAAATSASTSSTTPSMSTTPSTVAPSAATTTSIAHFVHVKTDLINVAIDPVGGYIVSTKLLKYPVSTAQKNTPMQILNPNPNKIYVEQSGLIGAGSPNVHYHTVSSNYYMRPHQSTLVVTLKGQTSKGLRVNKTFTFTRNEYEIKLSTAVENASSSVWKGGFFHQIVRKNIPAAHPYLQRRAYDGASISTHEKPYDKVSFKSMAEQNLNQTVVGGWVAMQQPYFVTSWVPHPKSINEFYSHSIGNGKDGANDIFTLGYKSTLVTLPPGKSTVNKATFYVGPALATKLVQASPNLSNTIDYGYLAPVSMVIFWFMKHIFSIIGNWGWTIILITLLIKLVFYPLSDKSYKSMAKMRLMQPRLKAIQDRHAGDKQATNKATMEFYKKEKLNPMGGCLPMLIQIPVFFALYYVLIESVQLRQAPWIWWIHDLSVRDPFYILPILMGASMFAQQKLSPAPPDATQAKVMMFMPIMFTVMFLWFPAGLVLYWLTNSLLSIGHQWYVLRTYDPKKEKYKKRDKIAKKKK